MDVKLRKVCIKKTTEFKFGQPLNCPTVTLVIKDDGFNDDEGGNDDHTERSFNKEPMYALLTGYQNTSNEFELEESI